MIPEHSATNIETIWRKSVPEICESRALQEHVPLITQSSSVTEYTHMPVARQVQMAALVNGQSIPYRYEWQTHAKQQGLGHGVPRDLTITYIGAVHPCYVGF